MNYNMNSTYMNYRFRGEVIGRPPEEGAIPTVGSRTGTLESGIQSLTYGYHSGIEVVADTIKGEEPGGYQNNYGYLDRFHVYTTNGAAHGYHRYGQGLMREWMFTAYGDGRVKFPEPVVLIPDKERSTEFALHALVSVIKEHFKDPTDIPRDIEEAVQEAVSAMAGRRLSYNKAEGSPRR